MDFTQFTLTYSETTVIFPHSPDVSAGQCLTFCDDTPSAAMLPSLFQQDGAPAHRSCHSVAYLRSNVPEFIEPENWLPNSPDLNPVDYAV